MKRVLITGSSGLIGSEAVTFFDGRGWDVHGVDNNMRLQFLGPDGDTAWNLARLRATTSHFTHHDVDMRDREGIDGLVRTVRPNFVIHCAAQPSHDLARARPFDDFDTNASGTLNLLEGMRHWCAETPFVFLSTNKVYGDAPNRVTVCELETRYDYARPEDHAGISETCTIDACLHSLFGASKLAADILVQEYGRYFGMPTVCFRAGCLTGPNHSSAELHGFLAYVARAIREDRCYRIYGYKGKQVRDNLHSFDVCRACLAFYERPRAAVVYNLGGGRANSVSVVEAIAQLEPRIGKRLRTEYLEEPRIGDHICYISDVRRFTTDYPEWHVSLSLSAILDDLARPGVGSAGLADAVKGLE
jgi:CDP-paratose 2-epimerase